MHVDACRGLRGTQQHFHTTRGAQAVHLRSEVHCTGGGGPPTTRYVTRQGTSAELRALHVYAGARAPTIRPTWHMHPRSSSRGCAACACASASCGAGLHKESDHAAGSKVLHPLKVCSGLWRSCARGGGGRGAGAGAG